MRGSLGDKERLQYFAISYDIIWEAIQTDLSKLKREVKKILDKRFDKK